MAKSTGQQHSTLGASVEALAYCYVFNVLLLIVVGHGYLTSVPAGTSALGWVVTLLAFVANFAMLALAPAVLTAVAFIARRRWVTLTAAVILFGLLNVFVYADSVIFSLWRFHFNGMVWNLLTTPGGGDNAIAGTGTVIYAAAAIALIFVGEIGFAVYVLPVWRRGAFAARLRNRRALGVSCAAMVGLIVFDKATFDVGDLRGDIEIMRVKQLLPLYQSFTIKRFAGRVLGMKIDPGSRLKFKTGKGSFDYPKAPLRFRPDGPRPNIVIIPIEGARFDMLTPEVMPFVSRWGADNIVFEDNYSAGNTTRYGILGLLYGIYGTYWNRALAEHTGPALIKSLKQLGYSFRVLCSADMNYPELHTTCFVDIQDAVTDRWQCERVQRDVLMTDAFVKFLDQTKGKPFFGFVFYDASHQPYRYPPQDAVFDVDGVTDDINYLKLPHDAAGMTFIRNRYKNSLHYVDREIERLVHALEQRGVLNDTLVFVMGDHGEEFRELGLFGHNSSFNQYQTKTLMVAHIPGETPRKVTRLTSHMDVPATILSYMGVENPLSDHTQGIPLTASQEQPYVFIASWDTAAIVDRTTTVTFGTESYKTETTILDENYAPLPNQRQALAAKRAELLDALNGMRQFTR